MEEIKDVADYAILKCKDKLPAWRQTNYQAKQSETSGAASGNLTFDKLPKGNPFILGKAGSGRKFELGEVTLSDVIDEFRPLYDDYMSREIGINEFAEKLGVDRKTIERLKKEYTSAWKIKK